MAETQANPAPITGSTRSATRSARCTIAWLLGPLFTLHGVALLEVRTADIYRGAIPIVVMPLLMLVLLGLLLGLETWLPGAPFAK